MSGPVDQYIDNLKRLSGAKTDTELAAKLAVAKQTIANWRRRGTVPLSQQKLFTALYGPEAAFDEGVGHAATAQEKLTLLSAFLRIVDKYRSDFDPRQLSRGYERWAALLLEFEPELQRLMRDTGWLAVDRDGKPTLFSANEHSIALLVYAVERWDEHIRNSLGGPSKEPVEQLGSQ